MALRGYAGLSMQHFLYFLPEPQSQGALRPIFGAVFMKVSTMGGWPRSAQMASQASTPSFESNAAVESDMGGVNDYERDRPN